MCAVTWRRLMTAVVLSGLAIAVPAAGQPIDGVGTRALGMAGAFVAVADDATAVYWNPAGLGTGDFFGLVVGHDRGEAGAEGGDLRQRGSATEVMVGTPPLGVGYYRLMSSGVSQRSPVPEVRAASVLVTHHVAVAIAQSFGDHVNVGAVLRVVRGSAASGTFLIGAPEPPLDAVEALDGRATTQLDVDLGAMIRYERFRAGLIVRNLREPEYETEGGLPLQLDRQVRAGVAFFPANGLTLSFDVDVTKRAFADATWRGVAAGIERRLTPRVVVRGGVRASTSGDARPAAAAGGSVALTTLLHVDAQVTRGAEDAPRGWSVGVRASF